MNSKTDSLTDKQKSVLEVKCMFPYLRNSDISDIVECSKSTVHRALQNYLHLYIPEKQKGTTTNVFLANEGQWPLYRYNPHQIAYTSVYMKQANRLRKEIINGA